MSQISTLTTLLNTVSDGQIKPQHYAYMAKQRRMPLFKMAMGGAIRKDESADFSRWGLGFGNMDGATYQTDYGQGMQSVNPGNIKQLEQRLPLFENSSEKYDLRQAKSHAKTNTQFTGFVQGIIDQNMNDIGNFTERKLHGVPATASTLDVLGLFAWLQPRRNASTGAVEAQAAGAYDGIYTVYGNGGAGTASICNIDRSSDEFKRYRNWCQSIDHEIGQNTFLAIQRLLLNTGYETLPFATERYSTGSLKNGGTIEPNQAIGREAAVAATRILCQTEDFLALQNYVEAVSPDDNQGDVYKFGTIKIAGIKLEEDPYLNPTGDTAMAGHGTIIPHRPIYVVNFAKWLIPHNGGLWEAGSLIPNPLNPTFQVLRQRSAQFNFRPLNDLAQSGGVLYRMTAA